MLNCRRKCCRRRCNLALWSRNVELTSQSNVDEVELRFYSKLWIFESKGKMHVVVVVIWLKTTCRMKHCMMSSIKLPQQLLCFSFDLKVQNFESILNSTSSTFDCGVNSKSLLHNVKLCLRLQHLRLQFNKWITY